MIFARRAIQRRLNELRATLPAEAVNDLVKKLNWPGADRLPRMWEVVVLHALAGLGSLENEVPLPSGRRPDVKFSGPAITFTADITAVSDEGLNEENPFDELMGELQKLKMALGLKTGGLDLSVRSQQEKTARGTRTSLRLPPRGQIREFVRTQIKPALQQQINDGQDILRLAFDEDKIAFQVTITTNGLLSRSGSYGAYAIPTIKTRNPLYNALRLKAGQLKGADGFIGVIVGDADTESLAGRQGHPDEITAREIAKDFLRQNKSISFVLLLSVREQQAGWLGSEPRTYMLRADLLTSQTQAVPEDLEHVFRQMMARMPQPVMMPVNAAYRAREKQYDLGHHGAHCMSGKRIKISVREFMEVLAGIRTISETNALHGWRSTTGQNPSGSHQNPFEASLLQGRLPKSISIVKTDENDNDDWLEIEIGEPDPAISPFR